MRHGYYDDAAVFRVRAGIWAQFGIPPTPRSRRLATPERSRRSPCPLQRPRHRRVCIQGPERPHDAGFINLRDNARDARQRAVRPVREGDRGDGRGRRAYAEYGEKAGGGIRGGKQDPLFKEGNAFFRREFPKLDFIRRATIVESAGVLARGYCDDGEV